MSSKAFLFYIYIAVKTFAQGRASSAFKRISKREKKSTWPTLFTRMEFILQKWATCNPRSACKPKFLFYVTLLAPSVVIILRLKTDENLLPKLKSKKAPTW